jgi:hypothetical protein
MNVFDPEPIRQLPVIQQEVLEREERPEAVGEQTAAVVPTAETEPVSTVPGTQGLEEPTVEVAETEKEPPELIPQELDESDDEAEDDDVEQEEEDDVPQVRHSTRIARGVRKPDRYAMVTKLRKEKEKDKKWKEAKEKAELAEVEMLLVGLRALDPVRKEDIGDADAHNSHLFTVEKLTADGAHDKFKSGMVMNGDEQDPNMYPERSSPTVAIHSLLTCLAVAAYNATYIMAKIDMKGAFVITEMVGPPVYIRCRKKVTDLMLKRFPGLKRYIGNDGLLSFKLLKALYGCVQASKLWFEKLTKVLRCEGYEHSPTDPCVMRRIVGDKIFLLLIYVDDIVILADETEVKRIEVFFQGRVHLDYDERGKCSVISWHANHTRARSSDSRYVLLP